jgi:hypothetical protein
MTKGGGVQLGAIMLTAIRIRGSTTLARLQTSTAIGNVVLGQHNFTGSCEREVESHFGFYVNIYAVMLGVASYKRTGLGWG